MSFLRDAELLLSDMIRASICLLQKIEELNKSIDRFALKKIPRHIFLEILKKTCSIEGLRLRKCCRYTNEFAVFSRVRFAAGIECFDLHISISNMIRNKPFLMLTSHNTPEKFGKQYITDPRSLQGVDFNSVIFKHKWSKKPALEVGDRFHVEYDESKCYDLMSPKLFYIFKCQLDSLVNTMPIICHELVAFHLPDFAIREIASKVAFKSFLSNRPHVTLEPLMSMEGFENLLYLNAILSDPEPESTVRSLCKLEEVQLSMMLPEGIMTINTFLKHILTTADIRLEVVAFSWLPVELTSEIFWPTFIPLWEGYIAEDVPRNIDKSNLALRWITTPYRSCIAILYSDPGCNPNFIEVHLFKKKDRGSILLTIIEALFPNQPIDASVFYDEFAEASEDKLPEILADLDNAVSGLPFLPSNFDS